MQGIATLPYEVQETPLVPTSGVASMRQAAEMLADFGREGDTYIVHAAEGETVIPVEVLDANPRMKKMLFKQMEEMGLDPERYIVGNELNSINPTTGQPEFFIKKLFKSVKKIAKKVAPIVLPIAAPFLLPAMPVAFAAGLGSFAGGMIAGQKPKDALRNAVITGGIAGLGNVAFGGSEGFGSGSFFGSRAAPSSGLGTFSASEAMTPVNPFSQAGEQQLAALQAQAGIDPKVAAQQNVFEKTVYDPDPNVVTGIDSTTGQVTTSGESFLEKYLSPTRTSLTPEFKAAQAAQSAAKSIDVTNQALQLSGQPALTEAAQQKMIADAVTKAATSEAPGVLAKYGPLGATGLGVAALMPPVDEDGDGIDDITGMQLYQQDREKFGFGSGFYGDNSYYQNPTFMPPVTVASGGEIVGPGTPTSDSIPAMLSDGEFVMNARAVRGAGGGDRQKGAKRMYNMMKQFEGRA